MSARLVVMSAVLLGVRSTTAFLAQRPAAALARRSAARSLAADGSESSAAASGGGRASAAVVQGEKKAQGGGGKKEKLDLNPPRGTRDFYPEDMRLQQWLFGEWRAVAALHGFSEYDAPVLESEALYVRKAGEEVTDQLYNFVDKGGRSVALRPEMTPSLARMVMAKRNTLALPLKWFSLPQCWRYERMTRGRRREHYQWNMDVWGIPGPEAEVELLAAAVSFFKKVGLTSSDIGIKVNSRAVLQQVLTGLGVNAEQFAPCCVLVDKLEKQPLDALRGDFHALGVSDECLEALVKVLAAKDMDSLRLALPPALADDKDASLSDPLKDLELLFTYAEAGGFADWLVFDASVVRGLAYYTGAVFEGFDRSGEFRAIFGGGRYDELLTTFGAKDPLPACGFGFGDAVITELLSSKGLLPPNVGEKTGTQMVVAVLDFGQSQQEGDGNLHAAAVQVASALRSQGTKVDLVLGPKKLKWVFKHAERLGVTHVTMIGPDEWNAESGPAVAIKDLQAGEQTVVPVADLETWATENMMAK